MKLAPGKVAQLIDRYGDRWIAHVSTDDCDAVYVWSDPELERGVVLVTFYFHMNPKLQRVCRVVSDTPLRELTPALAALVENVGAMPADVWAHLHGLWMKTPNGIAIFEGNPEPRQEERVLITDWQHYSTLKGHDSMTWVMTQVGGIIDPNYLR